ncbi:MAG: two-component sensor histidine kinase [Proteobacteria bacterium]|nr:two-component sensor histidine kinase [Pseudomonadota bacterium]
MVKDSVYKSLKNVILVSMIVVPFIPFIMTVGTGYYYFTYSLENSTISSMQRIVDDHRLMIESFLTERKADLEYALDAISMEDLKSPDTVDHVFERLQRKSTAFFDLGVFDGEGVHLAYHGPFKLTGKNYGREEWFKRVLQNGYYISDVFSGFREVPHFIIAVCREEKNGKKIIRATIDTKIFNNMVEKVRIGKTGEAYIINKDGILQTERRSGGELMTNDPDHLAYKDFHKGILTFIHKDVKGNTHLYATTWILDNKWILVVRQEKADAFKSLRLAAYLIILISMAGGIVITSLAFYISGKIVKWIRKTESEKGDMEKQLISATKLAELGEMAAGFAHEINNPLQIMKSEYALIKTILPAIKEKKSENFSDDMKEIEESMDQIELQINRCSKITHAILKFGRYSEPVSQAISLKTFLQEMIDIISKKASVNGIRLSIELSHDTPDIKGDPAQLQQVIINLFNNAMDAIMERHGVSGGILAVKSGKRLTNKHAFISVSDNGTGIAPEHLKKIFTPFFTTKPVGKGTGLGLSVCYGIIGNMGGSMGVESDTGNGTIFTIVLPAIS